MNHHSIRVRYRGGPADGEERIAGIGPYSDAGTRDIEIARLSRLVGEDSLWVFDPYDQDAYGCDLWAPAWQVIKATHRMQPGDLDRAPDRAPDQVLRLFRDPTGEGHTWYTVLREGEFVDARTVKEAQR